MSTDMRTILLVVVWILFFAFTCVWLKSSHEGGLKFFIHFDEVLLWTIVLFLIALETL